MTVPNAFKARMFEKAAARDTVVRAAETLVDEWLEHGPPLIDVPSAEYALMDAVRRYRSTKTFRPRTAP